MLDVVTKLNPKELQRLHLFKSVPIESIEGILESCVIRRLKKDEVLFVPAQPNRHLYQLMSGRLRIHLETPDSDPVSFIEPGETVGEMSVIDHLPTSAYVIADQDSRLLVLDEQLVWSLVDVSHAAAINLLQILTRRLRQANNLIMEKMQAEETFYHYGNIDVVTGMHNRRWLDMILPRQVRRSLMTGRPLALILLDIDEFRLYSETHGRLCGDVALNRIARAVMDHLRPTEIAVRYGGDEILILVSDIDLRVARNIAERIRQRVMYTDMSSPDGRKLPSLTVSLGVAQLQPEQTTAELVAVVEAAVHRAKEMGRNYVSE